MDAIKTDCQEDICRTCLYSVDDGLVSIYQDGEEVSIFDGISIAQMINECCVHPVKIDDPFPKKICIKCIDDIKIAYNFRKQSENSFNTLKSFLICGDNVNDDHNNDDDDNTEDVNALFFKKPIQIVNLNRKKPKDDLPPTEKCIQTDEVSFYPCEKCDDKFLDYEMLRKHRQCYHKGSENQCRFCLKTYSKISHLKRHLVASHPQVGLHYTMNNYTCKICNKHFKRNEILKKHLQQIHNKNDNLLKIDHVKVNKCHICSKIFKTDEYLKKHIQQNHNEHEKVLIVENDKNITIFHCALCSESFQNENNYKNHKCEKKDSGINNDTSLSIALMEPIMETEQIREKLYENDFLDTNSNSNEDFSQNDNKNVVDDFLDTNSYNNKNFIQDYDDNMDIPIGNDNDGNSSTDEDDIKPLAELRIEVRKIIEETNKIKSKRKLTSGQEGLEIKNLKKEIPVPTDKKSKKEVPASAGKKSKKEIPTPANVKLKEEIETEPSSIKIKQKKIHRCEQCNKVFTRSTHLKRHSFTHSDVKPFSCDICHKGFTRIDHLNLHKLGHAEVKPFTCDICNRGFVKSDYLRKHKESRHGNKSPNPKTEFCEICKRFFSSPKYLKTHIKSHSERRWNCRICGERFDDKSKLTEHMKNHANEKPFLCSECGLRFIRNDYLVIHMRRHKGEKPYKCKFCDKGFPRATDLTVHERYHTGEKTHLCTICGKGFQRAYNLLVHMRVHTGERPYQCPHCSKCFAQGNDLKAHIRRHTGERFKCDICGSGFIQAYHLTQHKRAAHGIESQSHIRRVEKFVTPTEQQKQVEALQSKLNESTSIKNSNSTRTKKTELKAKINAPQSSKLKASPQTQIYQVIEKNDENVVTKVEKIEIEEDPFENIESPQIQVINIGPDSNQLIHTTTQYLVDSSMFTSIQTSSDIYVSETDSKIKYEYFK